MIIDFEIVGAISSLDLSVEATTKYLMDLINHFITFNWRYNQINFHQNTPEMLNIHEYSTTP